MRISIHDELQSRVQANRRPFSHAISRIASEAATRDLEGIRSDVSVRSSLTRSCSRYFAELRRVIRPLAGLARQRSAGFITVLWCADIYCENRCRRWLKAR